MSTNVEQEHPSNPLYVDPQAAYRLVQIAATLFRHHQVHAVLREVVTAAQTLVAGDAAAILLYDRERAVFMPAVPSVAVGLDERWLRREGLEAAQALAARAMDAHDVLEILDATITPDLEYPLLAGQHRPGAVCAVPLEVEGMVVGVLELYTVRPRTLPSDVTVLRAFAALAGPAIANAQAHEREHELRTQLETLDEAGKVLAAELSPSQVLRRIVEIAVTLVGARYGALGVTGEDGYLADFITTGITPEERARLGPLPRGHGLLGVLINQGQPLRSPNIQRDPRRVGFPPHHPPMSSLLGVPIRSRGVVVGDLYLTDKIGGPEFTPDDQRLIELLAAHAGIAIQNARLYGELGDLARLRERDRIARDLHDGIIQNIYSATLQLEDVGEDTGDAATQARLLAIADHLSGVITDVRTYIQGLRARALQGRMLDEAITQLVQEVNSRDEFQAVLHVEGTPYDMEDARANTLLHIAREALTNVIKHAYATQADVRLRYDHEGVTLSVSDNGQGFDPRLPQAQNHLGLRNLRSRAEELGGRLTLVSTPGGDTMISAFIPSTS